MLSHEKSGKVKDVLASVVGLRLTIFHSKFIWRIFHDSEISLPKLRRLFKQTQAVTMHILTSVSTHMHILTSMNKYMHILTSVSTCMHILTSMNKCMHF